MKAQSRENFLSDAPSGVMFSGGGSRVRMRRQAMKSSPEIRPAFARVEFANPRGPLMVLFNIIGWITAPRDAPDATMVIASAERLWK